MQAHMRKLDDWHRQIQEAGVSTEELHRLQMEDEEAQHHESLRLEGGKQGNAKPGSGPPSTVVQSAEDLVALVLDGPGGSRRLEVRARRHFFSGEYVSPGKGYENSPKYACNLICWHSPEIFCCWLLSNVMLAILFECTRQRLCH